MRTCKVLLVAAFVAGTILTASATTIDFELNGPCAFAQTSPLSNQYAGQGVLFSGPGPGQGGAVLDECANFGINAHSGRDFLAFNLHTYGIPPETITFSTPQSSVSIFAGDGLEAANAFTLAAFDSMNQQIGIDTVNNIEGQWELLSVNAPNIAYVTLNFTGTFAVFDDMSFAGGATTPEPGTLMLLGTGLLGVIARFRKF